MHQNYEQKMVFGEEADASIKRMAVVKLMLDQKIDTIAIAGVAGVSERQVYNYKRQIAAGGDIYKDRHYRPVSDMDVMDTEIIESLKEQPVATAREASKRIEEITGLKRSTTQVRKFMHKHDLKPLKTASLPAKMDPAAQRKSLEEELEPRLARARNGGELKTTISKEQAEVDLAPIVAISSVQSVTPLPVEERADGASSIHNAGGQTKAEVIEHKDNVITFTPKISEAKAADETTGQETDDAKKSAVLFMDGVHCVWQAVLGVLWCVQRIFIPAASGRMRVNVLGAYDPVANKLLKIINRTYINSGTVCDMLRMIAASYVNMIVTVVLGNARYQHCALVINTAKELGIELLFLPTYSPNLNLIERLWKFLKAKCLTNEFYKTSREFEDAITSCLNKVETEYAEDIKRLLSMKFHLYDSFDELPTYFGKTNKNEKPVEASEKLA